MKGFVVDEANASYSSLDDVLFNKSKTELINYPMSKEGPYKVPIGVTTIGQAFAGCRRLTSITIPEGVADIAAWGGFAGCSSMTNMVVPASVMSVGVRAFSDCPVLTTVLFNGDAPSGGTDQSMFAGSTKATVYYRTGTKGWGKEFGGRPTAVWEQKADNCGRRFESRMIWAV